MAIDHIPIEYIITASRENGFYWVVINRDWMVAEWVSGSKRWEIPGYEGMVPEFAAERIDERRIINPNE